MTAPRSFRLLLLATGIAVALAASVAPALASAPRSVLNRGMYDDRYCEYLFVHPGGETGFYADVWNTYGLNDCPQDLWERSNTATLRQEMGSLFVKLNGPRHWLINQASITFDPSAKLRQGIRKTFSSGLRMRRLTTGAVPAVNGVPGLPSYTETTVNRTTNFTFSRRHPVRVLIAPDGKRYAMQAYSQIKQKDLDESQLDALKPRLALPAGWDYKVFGLRKDLTLRTRARTTVIQDEMENTYQYLPPSAYAILR